MAFGVADGTDERLEDIANKQRRYTRLMRFDGLVDQKRIDDMTFWVNNPTKGKSNQIISIT